MTPLKILKLAVAAFEELQCDYCLIGGHAASLYRLHERITKDVDFAVAAGNATDARRLAEQCIKRIGLKPVIGFIPAGPKEKKRRSVCMITSDPLPGRLTGLIDILLPVLPWVTEAVARAQYNKIDLKFRSVPVITPEDLIIAKCYALRNANDRFQDLDDLKELFINVQNLDLDYLRERLRQHALRIPEPIKKFAPKQL